MMSVCIKLSLTWAVCLFAEASCSGDTCCWLQLSSGCRHTSTGFCLHSPYSATPFISVNLEHQTGTFNYCVQPVSSLALTAMTNVWVDKASVGSKRPGLHGERPLIRKSEVCLASLCFIFLYYLLPAEIYFYLLIYSIIHVDVVAALVHLTSISGSSVVGDSLHRFLAPV